MEIKTKYKYGDYVWSMFSDAAIRFKIDDIFIYVKNYGQDVIIEYSVASDSGTVTKKAESKLYSSKEELIKSL